MRVCQNQHGVEIYWRLLALQVYEFTDTFIMVLKRNDRQISFLHVYHHASTFLW